MGNYIYRGTKIEELKNKITNNNVVLMEMCIRLNKQEIKLEEVLAHIFNAHCDVLDLIRLNDKSEANNPHKELNIPEFMETK